MTLDKLPIQKKAFVKGFIPHQQNFRRKLLTMGITPGCEVEVIRVAPLGDPIQIKLRGFQMFLRLSEAAIILIEPKHE